MSLQRRIAVTAATIMMIGVGFVSCSSDGGTEPDPNPTPKPGAVSGTVAAGATGVAGATLTLARTGASSMNATSASDGSYAFSSVAAGNWTLGIAPPSGYQLATGQAASVPVTVTSEQTTTVNVALAVIPPSDASIRAEVTEDGAAAQGVTVRLFNGGAGTARATQQTAANGATTFGSLAAGTYDVEVSVPPGFVLATGEQGKKSLTLAVSQADTVAFALETAPPSDTVFVNATGSLTFSPANVTINVGQTVKWTNTSTFTHNVTPVGHSEWTAATLSGNGSTFVHTFDTAGSFPYECTIHNGMTGTVTVQ